MPDTSSDKLRVPALIHRLLNCIQGSEAIASKLQPIASRKDYEAAIKSGPAVVVDFYAPW